MSELRLAKLPDRTPVRLMLQIPPELGRALAEYGELYKQAYGQAEPVQELIPAMLAAFLESDRGFARLRRRKQGNDRQG